MSAPTETIRVLHVDDDPSLADLVATFLEREDDRIDVSTATGPDAGRTILEERSIDCVVSDYDMPAENGIEFLETVRERHPDLPFILYTGKGSEEVASDAISAGVTDYLQKEGGTEQYAILANRIENAVAQRRAEREVERTREYFGTVLRHASDYVMIVDEDARVDYVSPAVERVLGYTPEELMGTNQFDLIHPDDVETARTALGTVIANPTEEHSIEFRVRHADGSWRWLEVRGRNLLDDPVVGGVIVNARDVTERRSSRHELQTVVDNLPGYVYRHRYESGWPLEFVKGSAETITGYTTAELEDDVSLAEEIIHPDDREEVWTGVEEGLAATGRFDLTYRIVTAGGETRWVRDQGQVVEDPTTGEELIDGFITDVTDRHAQERELRRYRHMVNAMQEATCIYDEAGRFEVVNDRLADFFGTTTDALVGRESTLIAEIRDAHDGDPYRALLDGDRTELRGEIAATFPERGERTLEYQLTPLTVDGTVEGVVGVTRDVTERMRRERTFERMRDLLERTERIADVGGWEIDTETTEVFWTDHLFEMLGIEGDEPALDEALDMYHEDDRPVIEDAIERALDTGDPFDVDVRFRRPDGEVRWLRIQGVPALDGDDVVTLRGAVQDITDRRERERQLEQAREEYEELLNGMNDTVWVLDTDGTVLAVNDAAEEVLGYSRAELRSMTPHDVDAHLDDDEITALIDDMPSDGQQVFETVHETRDGERLPIEISSSLVSYRGQTAILCVGRDVTERKARERRLKEFASVVSHDLRNPLTVARGRLEMARETCDSEHLDDVADAHERMNRLIDGLLALAREGDQLGDMEAVDVGALARESWDGVETAGGTLVVDLDLTIRADRSQFRQVFENLFRNSVEHGSTGSRPKADDSVEHGSTGNRRAEHAGDSVEHGSTDDEGVTITVGDCEGGFYVADDGPGISDDLPDDPFDAGISTSPDGIGVGLSIVDRVADAHGWTVRVVDGDDGGARFEFTGVDTVGR